MIKRNLADKLKELASYYPVVSVTGPRQAGKTTLCRLTFPDKPYVSLEPLDMRGRAQRDPRGFLAEYREGAIIDEVQHVGELFSYLQEEVDLRAEPGRFVLTGSQHFGMSARISQSLAGRVGILNLLPCSFDELERFEEYPTDLFDTLWSGGYPRIYDRCIPPDQWLVDYITTYVERDVRQILNVGDLQAFADFAKLCAGRTGQVLNLSSLGADAGVSHNTAKSWLSILEAGFLVFRLSTWHKKIKKQIVKAPKLHFFDSGLVCNLLGIRTPAELVHHPLRGSIFESWVVSEVYKAQVNKGIRPRLYYFRDHKGFEVDLIAERGENLILAETKSAATLGGDFFHSLHRLQNTIERSRSLTSFPHDPLELRLIYGGDRLKRDSNVTVAPWSKIHTLDWS